MTEEEKKALRNPFSGKKVSEMTPQERELFDKEFKYGFSSKPKSKPSFTNSKPLPKSKDLTMRFLSRMNFIVNK